MKTLLIDNYDSFTYNLYQYLSELGGEPVVRRNDRIGLAEVESGGFTHLVLSPGPGNPYTPRDIGICPGVVSYAMAKRVPLLGVCLGHQILTAVFGGSVSRAPSAIHGKASRLRFGSAKGRLFEGIHDGAEVMRYHSLCAQKDDFPSVLRATAVTDDAEEVIMACEHAELPIAGVQFHPESIGTPCGKDLLRNFLSFA